MKSILRKTVLMAGLSVVTLGMLAAPPVKTKKKTVTQPNALMQASTLPYGAPDFTKIREADYLPAIKAAIAQQRAEIARIVANKQKPTFQNTILAYEKSGRALDRVTSIFFGVSGAHKTPGLETAEGPVIAAMTDWENEMSFNQRFFRRVKYVYDHELGRLQGEDRKLTEEIYKGFVRSGALLPADKMKRMEAINKRLATLQQDFGNMLPKATNAAAVWVSDVKELAGLSEADIAQCRKDAESRGAKAPYCIVIVNTTQQPILAQLQNRDLRRRVYEASIHRTDGTGEYNTFPVIVEMARLRAEKAALMGYKDYASYSLDRTMARTPEAAYAFLRKLIAAYQPKIEAETREIEAYARQTEGADFKLQPYDRFYYSARMKRDRYSFSDDEVKPYFNLDTVLIKGVFYAAGRVYGLSFREHRGIPTYHPDMKVYDVLDATGRQIALFYTDFYRRPTKRGGAWMSSFAKQSGLRGQIPVIYNVCNTAKAPEGQPTLLTWDEVTTMFHEFGHALHGILSDCRYNTLSGTAVARDFVEMPSQFNESFASLPEVFNNFARHYQTNEPMPAELKDKMLGSLNFQSAYALGENLAATCVDMAWHCLSAAEVPSADKAADFETEALRRVGLFDAQVPPRYRTSYFNHVWGGGYAAGYYSYLWSEVLAVNVADYFARHGALTREVGDSFRQKVLSRGNTRDLMTIFSDFTGLTSPDAAALLKARGL